MGSRPIDRRAQRIALEMVGFDGALRQGSNALFPHGNDPCCLRHASIAPLQKRQRAGLDRPCRRPRDCDRGRECRAPRRVGNSAARPGASPAIIVAASRPPPARGSDPRDLLAASASAASPGCRRRARVRSLLFWSAKARNMRCIGSVRVVERGASIASAMPSGQADPLDEMDRRGRRGSASARARVRRAPERRRSARPSNSP